MDGRVQIPAIKWLQTQYNADYVDVITEAGPNKIIAENNNTSLIDSIKNRLNISIEKHNSSLIALDEHYNCADNSIYKEQQIRNFLIFVNNIKKWGYNTTVI